MASQHDTSKFMEQEELSRLRKDLNDAGELGIKLLNENERLMKELHDQCKQHKIDCQVIVHTVVYI